MYGSWDMEQDRHNFLSFWTIFYPFTLKKKKTPKKSKFWKNEKKKYMEISSFYTVYQKSWLYATLSLRYNAWQM